MAGFSIRGIQEAQARNAQRMAALKPSGAFGQMIQMTTATLHRFMGTVTHVDTGALKSAELMEVSGTRGKIFINPNAVNPKNGGRPADYGVFENARGGEHAFFDRTLSQADAAVNQGVHVFLSNFPS